MDPLPRRRRYTRSVIYRGSICGLVLLAAAIAQIPATDAPVLRGVLLECDSGSTGELAVRGPESEVILYRFDAKTRVERAGVSTSLELIKVGETIEISSTPAADSPVRYAASVVALDPVAPPRIARQTQRPAPLPQLDPLFPRGDMTFSGVVSFLSSSQMILRTRAGEDQTILLRRDTRYLANGNIAKPSDLKANMRVFVRAGKDLYGHTEAYQVVWGGILQP